MVGPFAGLRVVEFGQYIAVPYCAQLLADGGADVVKVEPLDGDPTRHNGEIIPGEARQFLNKNRGKRSLAIDLGDQEALDAVHTLVATADIVLVNFRPGLAERLGLDYPAISQRNPRVIYAENTAFGRTGPMADAPGMDIIVAAYAGLTFPTDEGPQPFPDPIVDYTAALLLAWGISTALYHRERTGHGQKLDVSLLHAAMVLQNNHLIHVDAVDGWRYTFLEFLKNAFTEGRSWSDIWEERERMQPFRFLRAYYGFFRTSDGAIAIATAGHLNRQRLLRLLQLEDPWVTDPGWQPADAAAYAEQLYAQVASVLRTRTTAEWLEECARSGIPASPLRLREELFEDPQARANEAFVRLEHDLVGGLTVVAPPVRYSATPLAVLRASPPLGSHSREVLRELGLSDTAVDRLITRNVVRDYPKTGE